MGYSVPIKLRSTECEGSMRNFYSGYFGENFFFNTKNI